MPTIPCIIMELPHLVRGGIFIECRVADTFLIFVAHAEKSLQSGSPMDVIEMYHHCKMISTSVVFEWNRMPPLGLNKPPHDNLTCQWKYHLLGECISQKY